MQLLGTFELHVEEFEGLTLEGGGTSEEVEGLGAGETWGEAVFDDGGEIVEQGAEAVDGQALLGAFGASLVLSGRGGFGGRHDGRALGAGRVMVVEQQGGEALTHVPFDVVGEHAQQDVGTHALGGTVMNGPDLEVHGLEASEGTLDPTEAFVGVHRPLGIELVFMQAGAHDVEAVEGGLAGDGLGGSSVAEGVVADVEVEVLGHLVLVDDPAHP